MKECITITLCAILFVLQISSGLESNKQQRLNTNTDFLLHEGGVQTSGNKRDYVGTQSYGNQQQTYGNQNGGSPNYDTQFPALCPPSSHSQTIAIKNVNIGRQSNAQSSNGKRDYVAPQSPTVKPTQNNQNTDNSHMQMSSNNQNSGVPSYSAQFPSLGPSSAPQSHTTASHSANGKRDYVAPQYPTVKPMQQNHPNTGGNSRLQSSNSQNGGGSNYATQFPSLGPPSSPQSPSTPSQSPKRDYVAPQFPTVKPTQQNNQPIGGKVKDLINFYDSKNPSQGPFSYSSALQGSGNKNRATSIATSPTRFTQPVTQSTLSTASVYTPKPMSFSSVVSGNKPSSHTTFTTSKPTTRMPNTPTSRPGTPILPSSLVNNNRGSTNTNAVTDAELEVLSEELLRKDTNNAAKYITVNYQAKTTSQSPEDKAPLPLITVSPEVWNIPTIQKFVPLLDNYERDTLVNEYVTPQERNEENAFMDAVMSTTVMRHLMTFLKNKGYVTPDPKQQRDFVKQLWFSLYSRGKGKISSSGFEHIFVSELKNGEVSGGHNWIYFAKEEAANRANYLGYLKYVELNDKGVVMKYHFNQQGVDKPVNTIFIGTSPELEMALYTLCFVTRVDNDCKLKLGTKDVNIITYNFRYRSKNLIGSSFPQI